MSAEVAALILVSLVLNPAVAAEECVGQEKSDCPWTDDLRVFKLEQCAWCLVNEGQDLADRVLEAPTLKEDS